MRRTPSRLPSSLLAVPAAAALLALSGCGSDGDPTPAPASATSTSSAPQPSATSSDPSAAAAPEPPVEEGAPAVAPHRDDEADLQGEDQRGDGTSVRVEDVQLSTTDGWVAVFAADGGLLGATPVVRSDEDVDLDVVLSPAVTGTQELRAVLYADDGDGVLDLGTDPQVAEDDDDGDDDGDDDDVVADRFTLAVG